jgi:hypothetical protein
MILWASGSAMVGSLTHRSVMGGVSRRDCARWRKVAERVFAWRAAGRVHPLWDDRQRT